VVESVFGALPLHGSLPQNVAQDLQLIGWMLFASAVLTAVCVGLSPYQSRLMRVFLVIGGIIALWVGAGLVLTSAFGGGSVLRGGAVFSIGNGRA
jgi:hypothetical protein